MAVVLVPNGVHSLPKSHFMHDEVGSDVSSGPAPTLRRMDDAISPRTRGSPFAVPRMQLTDLTVTKLATSPQTRDDHLQNNGEPRNEQRIRTGRTRQVRRSRQHR